MPGINTNLFGLFVGDEEKKFFWNWLSVSIFKTFFFVTDATDKKLAGPCKKKLLAKSEFCEYG
jgi:hypothetical protein